MRVLEITGLYDIRQSVRSGTAGLSNPAVRLTKSTVVHSIAFAALMVFCLGIDALWAQATTPESESRAAKILQMPNFGILMFNVTLKNLKTNKVEYCTQGIATFTGPDGEPRKAIF